MRATKTILLACALLSASAPAAVAAAPGDTSDKPEATDLVFIVGQNDVPFTRVPSRQLLISSACRTGPKSFSCKAYDALSAATLKGTLDASFGGKNPGSLVCRKVGGRVVIGLKKDNKAEYSLCEFSDRSLVDGGTLSFFARMNDMARGRD